MSDGWHSALRIVVLMGLSVPGAPDLTTMFAKVSAFGLHPVALLTVTWKRVLRLNRHGYEVIINDIDLDLPFMSSCLTSIT